MFDKLLDRIEIRIGKYRGIRNLMLIIVAGMAAVYAADFLLPSLTGFYLSSYLTFNRAAILRGEIWRLVTFVFVPQNDGMLFFILQLMFLYFTGNMLQNQWGTLRFNLFYFCGLLCSMIAGFITGYATSYYINLSMLLAVAILFPQMQVNFYGIFPLRMKWLALIDLLLLLPSLINGTWAMRVAIIISLMNVALFFSSRLVKQLKEAKRRYEWKKNWRSGNWR